MLRESEARAAASEARAAASEARAALCECVRVALTRAMDGFVDASRGHLAAARPALGIADGASIDEFEIIERVGRRSHPIAGSR